MIENLKIYDNENLEEFLGKIKGEREIHKNIKYSYGRITISKATLFSSVIENVNFSNIKWDECEFVNVRFINCNFGSSHFYMTNFKECQFSNCNFRVGSVDSDNSAVMQCQIMSCKMEHILIKDSDLLEVYIRRCEMKYITVENSRLDYGKILDCNIDVLMFKNCYLIWFELMLNKSWKDINFYSCIMDEMTSIDPQKQSDKKFDVIILLNNLYRSYLYSGIKDKASEYYIRYKDADLRYKILDLSDLIKGKNRWKYRGISDVLKTLLEITGNLVNKHLFGYGEKVSRLISSACVFLLTFSCIYFFLGISYMGEVVKFDLAKTITENFEMFFKTTYFSVITFSTLGYGDILPNNNLVRFFSMLEVLSGVIYTAAITATIYKKISKE